MKFQPITSKMTRGFTVLICTCAIATPSARCFGQPSKDQRPSAFNAFCTAFTRAYDKHGQTYEGTSRALSTAASGFSDLAKAEAKYRHAKALAKVFDHTAGHYPTRKADLFEWGAREETADFTWSCPTLRRALESYGNVKALTRACAAKDKVACNWLRSLKLIKADLINYRSNRERAETGCAHTENMPGKVPQACHTLYTNLRWLVRDVVAAERVATRLCGSTPCYCREAIALRLHLGNRNAAVALLDNVCASKKARSPDVCSWPLYWLGRGPSPREKGPLVEQTSCDPTVRPSSIPASDQK